MPFYLYFRLKHPLSNIRYWNFHNLECSNIGLTLPDRMKWEMRQVNTSRLAEFNQYGDAAYGRLVQPVSHMRGSQVCLSLSFVNIMFFYLIKSRFSTTKQYHITLPDSHHVGDISHVQEMLQRSFYVSTYDSAPVMEMTLRSSFLPVKSSSLNHMVPHSRII